MQKTIRFSLSTLLCLSLLFVSGCGGDPKTAMTEATKQLLTAIVEAEKATDHPNGILGFPKETIQKVATTFKTKANAINFGGCPDDFKDAASAVRQAYITMFDTEAEHYDSILADPDAAETKFGSIGQAVFTAMDRFKEVCEKHGVDLQQIGKEMSKP